MGKRGIKLEPLIERDSNEFVRKYSAVFGVLKDFRDVILELRRLPDTVNSAYEKVLRNLKNRAEHHGLDQETYDAQKSSVERAVQEYDLSKNAIPVSTFEEVTIPAFNHRSAEALERIPDFKLVLDAELKTGCMGNDYGLWFTYSSPSEKFEESHVGNFGFLRLVWAHAWANELMSKETLGQRFAPVLDMFALAYDGIRVGRSPVKQVVDQLEKMFVIESDNGIFYTSKTTRDICHYLSEAGYLSYHKDKRFFRR